MEKLTVRTLEKVTKAVLRTGAASGIVAFGVTSLDILTKPQTIQAAEPCRAVDSRTVQEFVDVGGVKDQYDPVIDILKDPISRARVRYILNGSVFTQSQETNNQGVVETEIKTDCNGPEGRKVIILNAEVTTADGRRVIDPVVLQNGRKEKFTTYVVDRKKPLGSVKTPETTSGQSTEDKKRIDELEKSIANTNKSINDLTNILKEKEKIKNKGFLEDLSFSNVSEFPIGTVLALLAAAGLTITTLLDRPLTKLQAYGLNRPRTRIWNTIAYPIRYFRYSRAVAAAAALVPPGPVPAPPTRYWSA